MRAKPRRNQCQQPNVKFYKLRKDAYCFLTCNILQTERRIIMRISKKHIIAASAAIIASASFMASQPAEAKATYQQERSWEVWQISDDQSKYRMVQSQKGSRLRRIQDELVKYNSDVLNYKDGVHGRWVQPVWLNEDSDEDRSYSLGGYIVLTQKKVDSLTQGRENTARSLYSNSLIASPVAHELGHYVNEDTINRVADRDDTHVKSEYAADEEAWALLESVPEYSIGSQLTDNLLRKQGKYAFELNNTKSASDDKRIGAIIGHISKISGGRVKIDEACRLTVDGRPFMGTGYVPASDDATKEERTAYLAGQIASCMKDGLWTRSRVDYMPESEFCEGGRPDYTVVVIRKGETANGGPTGEIAKVLGTFAFSLKDNKYSRNVQAQKEADTVNAILSQMEGRERPSV